MGGYQGQPSPEGQAFHSLTRAPATQFVTSQVPAPTELYVSGDAQIRLRVTNWLSAFPPSFNFTYKLILSDTGVLTTFEQLVQLTAGTTQVQLFALQEGFLLSAEVQSGSAANRGQVFVVAEIVRGSGADLKFERVLFADYVVTGQSIGFPTSGVQQSVNGRGFLHIINSGGFGAGAEVLMSPGANERMQLIGVNLTFVTSAAAGTRTPELRLLRNTSAGLILAQRIPIPGTLGPTTTTSLQYLVSGPQPVLNNGVILMPLPAGMLLESSDELVTVTGALQAGDQYTVASFYGESWVDG